MPRKLRNDQKQSDKRIAGHPVVVLLVFFDNPDFYDSGVSGSLAIIVLVPRPENNEMEL